MHLESLALNLTRNRRRLPGPFSSTTALTNLDRRTAAAKIMKRIVRDLMEHLGGDPTPPQRLLVQSASIKALRLALLADRLLTEESLAEGADHHCLAWSNSMRLDLQALGLERRERPLLNLAAYLKTPPTDATTAERTTTPATADTA
jgi:hypothetical protein